MVAVVWSLLGVWRPTTTWHLAPLLLASAWPWVVGQDIASGDAAARRRILLAGGAGLTAALALTGALSSAGRLDIVTVEGAAYFPLGSIPEGVLSPSGTTSVCPWKGIESDSSGPGPG